MKAEKPLVVDLNRANLEELGALPDVGPALAQRILAYREEQGPFRSPADIAAIPDIGLTLHKRLADHLTVTLTEGPPVLAVEIPPEGEEPAPEAGVISPEEEPSPAAVGPALSEVAPEEVPAPPRAGPAAPVPQVSPAPFIVVSRGSVLSWLLSALVGGVLGMIFSLLVLYGINGSLDIGHSRVVLGMENRMDGLAADVDSLQGEVDGLRQRLGLLEGLTARMDRAESAVDDLREETAVLGERADALEDRVAAVSEDLAAVQAQTQRVEAFFQRLQALLNEFFGGTEVVPTPALPPATPSPNQ